MRAAIAAVQGKNSQVGTAMKRPSARVRKPAARSNREEEEEEDAERPKKDSKPSASSSARSGRKDEIEEVGQHLKKDSRPNAKYRKKDHESFAGRMPILDALERFAPTAMASGPGILQLYEQDLRPDEVAQSRARLASAGMRMEPRLGVEISTATPVRAAPRAEGAGKSEAGESEDPTDDAVTEGQPCEEQDAESESHSSYKDSFSTSSAEAQMLVGRRRRKRTVRRHVVWVLPHP